jgi:Domain of unknown function (DUF4331)
MRKLALATIGAAALVAFLVAAVTRGGPGAAQASSHREAPLISEDPSADNTDLYAFVSPDKPDTFTILSNWIPGEDPAAGPNWYTFSPTARYNILIDRTGDGRADVAYRFRFTRPAGQFFLGNTVQRYTVTRVVNGKAAVVAQGETPPDNIGPRSTPNYAQLAASKIVPLDNGGVVFAGQRDDPFFGDIGDIFDLVAIRKGIGNEGGGRDFFAGYAVHTIGLQLPIADVDTPNHVIGVWSSTDRQITRVTTWRGVKQVDTPWQQVSRLGNPLVNEVIIPTTQKDLWNRLGPSQESRFADNYRKPILAAVINQLYHLDIKEDGRDDLVSVLLTGVPQLNNTGPKLADELRLNLSIKPTAGICKGNRLGVLGGDLAGWPDGRRLEDDVIDIAEQAVAGALIGTKIPLGDGVNADDRGCLASFPYVSDPQSGADNTKGQQKP